MPVISLIVAAAANDVIGAQGALPWHLPDDLKRFKAVTTGKPVVMGRKTFESIGRPLPNRHNIVISRQPGFGAEGCDVVSSVEDALTVAGDVPEIMVIGGSEIYALFLPIADRLHLTRVQANVEGDAFFPAPDPREWRLLSEEPHARDDAHQHAFAFRVYERTAE